METCRTFASTAHSFTTLWQLKLAEIAKSTFNVLALAISVVYVMSAGVQTHVLQDITLCVTTCLTIPQEMAQKGSRMEMEDQGVALVGHSKEGPDEAAYKYSELSIDGDLTCSIFLCQLLETFC